MREALAEALTQMRPDRNFTALLKQRGLFSFCGLNRAQSERLRDEFAIYTPSNGRINVAGLNEENLDYVAQAVAAVL